MKKKSLILTLIIFFINILCFSQQPTNKDTLYYSKHSANKASIYSAILPGLGQVYNKKYWKVPIIYAGFGTLAYSYYFNDKKYSSYKNEFYIRINNDSTNFNPDLKIYSTENIQELKNYYQRNRELSLITSGLWYILNIIDAAVDAHLYEFDVSDDLSFTIKPIVKPIISNEKIFYNSFYSGVSLNFTIK